jgi:hypothetical protein
VAASAIVFKLLIAFIVCLLSSHRLLALLVWIETLARLSFWLSPSCGRPDTIPRFGDEKVRERGDNEGRWKSEAAL